MIRLAATLVSSGLAALAAPVFAALPTVAAPPGPAASGAGSLLQAMVGMVVVIALIFGLAWAMRRFGLQRLGGSSVVRIVSSAAVGTRERVVVVELAGTWLVLGVTGSQVSMLHSLPAQASQQAAEPAVSGKVVEAFALRLRDAVTGRAAGR